MNKYSLQQIGVLTLLAGSLSLTSCNDEETMQTDARVALQVTSGCK